MKGLVKNKLLHHLRRQGNFQYLEEFKLISTMYCIHKNVFQYVTHFSPSHWPHTQFIALALITVKIRRGNASEQNSNAEMSQTDLNLWKWLSSIFCQSI